MAFAVETTGVSDKDLEFIGYYLIEQNDEFKIYRNKYMEDHIVKKSDSLLYVDELDEAQCLGAGRIVQLHGMDT
jgi:hypothetical protein